MDLHVSIAELQQLLIVASLTAESIFPTIPFI